MLAALQRATMAAMLVIGPAPHLCDGESSSVKALRWFRLRRSRHSARSQVGIPPYEISRFPARKRLAGFTPEPTWKNLLVDFVTTAISMAWQGHDAIIRPRLPRQGVIRTAHHRAEHENRDSRFSDENFRSIGRSIVLTTDSPWRLNGSHGQHWASLWLRTLPDK